jgi:TonB family protein
MIAPPGSTLNRSGASAVTGSVLLLAFAACSVDPSVRDASGETAVCPVQYTRTNEPPRMLNQPEVWEALIAGYPAALREAGMEGTTTMSVCIDEGGLVAKTRLVRSSGNDDLDEVATNMMETVARFSPATVDDEPVPVWVQLPVTLPHPR